MFNGISWADFQQILKSLYTLTETSLIFTLPNFDKDSGIIEKEIINFCSQKDNAYFFKSLGQKAYFSTIKIVDGVVGNSSSGLTEVSMFNKGTVNIGQRQLGRIKEDTVIDCKPDFNDIIKAIKRLYSPKFLKFLTNRKKKSSTLETSKEIVKILEKTNFELNESKKFCDLTWIY